MSTFAPYLPGILAAYAILAMGAASPGPAVAMLLGISSGQGRGAALTASAGIAAGSMTINILTLLGVGLLISQAAWAMTLLRIIGAAYLLYLAWGAFSKAVRPPRLQAIEVTRHGPRRLFVMGYLLQVTNPKAIAFWLAIAAIGAVDGAPAPVIATFILGALALSFGFHGAWAVLLSASPVRAAYARARRWVEGALGLFFSFAAYKLATSEV